MANRFKDSFNNSQNQNNQGFSDPQNTANQFNEFRNNPIAYLNNKGFQIPQEYANSPEATAKYMLRNMPGVQQNRIFQLANMLGQMFGFFR